MNHSRSASSMSLFSGSIDPSILRLHLSLSRIILAVTRSSILHLLNLSISIWSQIDSGLLTETFPTNFSFIPGSDNPCFGADTVGQFCSSSLRNSGPFCQMLSIPISEGEHPLVVRSAMLSHALPATQYHSLDFVV